MGCSNADNKNDKFDYYLSSSNELPQYDVRDLIIAQQRQEIEQLKRQVEQRKQALKQRKREIEQKNKKGQFSEEEIEEVKVIVQKLRFLGDTDIKLPVLIQNSNEVNVSLTVAINNENNVLDPNLESISAAENNEEQEDDCPSLGSNIQDSDLL